MPKQVPTFQKIQKPANDPQVQYYDKVVEVPVVMQRPVPSVQTAQKITEVPHIDTDKQVSLREIIPNAADTLETVRFHNVQDESFPGDRKDPEIMVEHDQDAQTTSIIDNDGGYAGRDAKTAFRDPSGAEDGGNSTSPVH